MTTAREALADLIAEERDKYPRRADDMDSEELAAAILSAFPGIRETIEGPVPPRKTIAERVAFDAAVSNRAREIADIRALAAAATAPEPEWEYGATWQISDWGRVGYASSSRELAAEEVAMYLSDPEEFGDQDYRVGRRIPARAAGPWEVCDE